MYSKKRPSKRGLWSHCPPKWVGRTTRIAICNTFSRNPWINSLDSEPQFLWHGVVNPKGCGGGLNCPYVFEISWYFSEGHPRVTFLSFYITIVIFVSAWLTWLISQQPKTDIQVSPYFLTFFFLIENAFGTRRVRSISRHADNKCKTLTFLGWKINAFCTQSHNGIKVFLSEGNYQTNWAGICCGPCNPSKWEDDTWGWLEVRRSAMLQCPYWACQQYTLGRIAHICFKWF